MKILIVNADPVQGPFDNYLENVASVLRDGGHETEILKVRGMDIGYCTGCWSCWWKTPGLCAQKDDMAPVYGKMLGSDAVLLGAPLMTGFVSSLLKKFLDRTIPVLHPYIKLQKGESHHRKRYSKYPSLAAVVDPGHGSDDEDVAVAGDFIERTAFHFWMPYLFTVTSQHTPAVVADLIAKSAAEAMPARRPA